MTIKSLTAAASLMLSSMLGLGASPLIPAAVAGTPAPSNIYVGVAYRWEHAQPVVVNGTPVLAHQYWSCIDTVTVQFQEPMRLASLVGNVDVEGPYNSRRALVLRSVDASFRRYVWEAGKQSLCNNYAAMSHVLVHAGVWTVTGGKLATDYRVALAFPASRNATAARLGSADVDPADVDPADVDSADVDPADFSSREVPELAAQIPKVTPADSWSSGFTVTPARLNAALAAMQSFPAIERTKGLYASGLQLMPLEFRLQPFAAANRGRQYGSPDTLYALRRAARFTQLLFPTLTAIPVADISEADGSTPHSGTIVLHPDGAHTNGKDVDVAYLTTGSGNSPGAGFDFERNFWFLYGLLDSTGVDMVITAYKSNFVDLARRAYAQGLINSHAVGRFAEVLMADFAMNHDKHMHVSVTNLANDGRSRKFTGPDDVYGCYLGLTAGSADGAYNYCDVQPAK